MADPWYLTYFDADFIRLYAPLLPEEESCAEAEAVVELLGLEAGARVLDLACGWGRHAVELADLGMRVTGVDFSQALLEHARGLAQERGVEVEWVQQDVREPLPAGEYDAVVSLFSSFGYFGADEADVRVLRRVREALAEGGSFLLETVHRDLVARDFLERDWWETEEGEPVWVERYFDGIRGVTVETLRWLSDGHVREKSHEMRIRSATEWAELLSRAELHPLAWYGGWDAEPFTIFSDRLIVVASAAV